MKLTTNPWEAKRFASKAAAATYGTAVENHVPGSGLGLWVAVNDQGEMLTAEGCGEAVVPFTDPGFVAVVMQPPAANAVMLSADPVTTDGFFDDDAKPGDWFISKHERCRYWDNCDGEFWVLLPCGDAFNLSWRASNCAAPEDRLHRCWKLNGTPPNVSTSPGCGGNHSILCHCGWHGYLRNGALEKA